MLTELKNGNKIQTKVVPIKANVWVYLCAEYFGFEEVAYLSDLLNIKDETTPKLDPNKNSLIVKPLSPITCLQMTI
jgi:hypothetical protein